jgi:hypothetical protein
MTSRPLAGVAVGAILFTVLAPLLVALTLALRAFGLALGLPLGPLARFTPRLTLRLGRRLRIGELLHVAVPSRPAPLAPPKILLDAQPCRALLSLLCPSRR